ncbi:unnamed protein product [Porites lobata]|uniref:ZP domain-containing protein n=1 Tax=Porites lobata TaxID=104759 RepID=A0ABN8N8K8_9CNID|nr:unnamed protein product [Porites lobata]
MAHWVAACLFFLVALQWLSVALASHFRYGTMSWAPVDSYSNTIRFTFGLAFRRSSVYCDSNTISTGSLLVPGDSWTAKCVNYTGNSSQCNSVNIGSTGFRCTDYSTSEDWSLGENNFTHTFSSIHDEWIVSYRSCCWISLSRYGGSWLVSTTVNLTRRLDNGRINSSPVSRSPAIIRWSEGCPSQSLRIPIEDADEDVVKCRYAKYSESYFQSDSFPYGTLDEKTCLLTFNGNNGTTGIYAVALMLEDFPAGTTNFVGVTPFSAVGLQFLVIISSHSGSCNNVPVFTPSSPNDGECTEVQIGSLYRAVIEVTLADVSKHIVEIVASSPPGMVITSPRQRGQGVYYSNVTWYPSQYQVGKQSFCFKAVDSSGLGSQYRCITILVGISNTPRVILGSRTPHTPLSTSGPGIMWWSIQFDRVIKKPRSSSFIRLVLLPSEHTVHKVDTLSQFVIINSDQTTLQFAMPYAALSMNGSYAILMDRGAVVGQGCSYDGPPTPGITNTSDWQFTAGVCPVGYTLALPDLTSCVDMNECGSAAIMEVSVSGRASTSVSVSSSYSAGISPSISASVSASTSTSGSVLVSPSYSASISPSISASVSGYYAPFSLNALSNPMDFLFHVPADCHQICKNTPGSYSCSCFGGYQLSSDGKSCLDIDECLTNNGGCSHYCYNIPGSFFCGCPERTTMASNNLTCVEPGATVTCDENNMTVSLEKQSFPFFDANNLHLRYSSCRATQNSTHVLISTTLNACGTLVNETEDALIFWNEIQVDAVIVDNVITRTHDINLRFHCSYSRKRILSIQSQPQQIFIGSEAGYGNFTFRMDFYRTAAFATPYTENDYPISVPLNEFLYVKYSVESSADLVIMAENCRTTKTAYFYSLPQYNLIQNGCGRDTTMEYTYNPSGSSQQFKIRSFRFFNDYDVVYFHCELFACYRYSFNSRCSRGCLSSKRRKRRDAIDEIEHEESTSKHILSSGPIMITETETEKRDEGDTEKSQKPALIIGAGAAGGFALIVIIALAVLAVKYRLARRLMNRNKVGDLYTTQDEQMSRRNAYIQEDDMIEREDSF